jgi:hypothetical protein
VSKFTFKRHPKETGLRSVGHPDPWVDIKLAKKVVGSIVPPTAFTRDDAFKVMLMVADPSNRCGWEWVTLKFRGDTEQSAREFLTTNAEAIQAKYPLYMDSED